MSKMTEVLNSINNILVNAKLSYELVYTSSERSYIIKIKECSTPIDAQESISMEELEDICREDFEIVSNARESFMTNHENRMAYVKAKIDKLFEDDYKTSSDEIDKSLDEINKSLKGLL